MCQLDGYTLEELVNKNSGSVTKYCALEAQKCEEDELKATGVE